MFVVPDDFELVNRTMHPERWRSEFASRGSIDGASLREGSRREGDCSQNRPINIVKQMNFRLEKHEKPFLELPEIIML